MRFECGDAGKSLLRGRGVWWYEGDKNVARIVDINEQRKMIGVQIAGPGRSHG